MWNGDHTKKCITARNYNYVVECVFFFFLACCCSFFGKQYSQRDKVQRSNWIKIVDNFQICDEKIVQIKYKMYLWQIQSQAVATKWKTTNAVALSDTRFFLFFYYFFFFSEIICARHVWNFTLISRMIAAHYGFVPNTRKK